MSKIYVSVKSDNFIYFAKESEYRKKISHLTNHEKIDKLISILEHISKTVQFELFNKSDIEDFNKNEYASLISDSDSSSNNSSDSD